MYLNLKNWIKGGAARQRDDAQLARVATMGVDAKDSMLLLLDVAFAARTFYCFMRQYFVSRHEPPPPPPPATADDEANDNTASSSPPRKPIRVYMDGCFDAMHFGHANALRQARALGDTLVVGINPAREIVKHKGPPIMSDAERGACVEAVKWVDEVLPDVPYVVTPAFLDELIHRHRIDIIVHGDDPCVGADGRDVYEAVKRMGRFRTVKRTEGVSSTDIVARMLQATSHHHLPEEEAMASASSLSPFLPTTRRILQFAGEKARAPRPSDRVVYVDGAFDMFHAGHVALLRQAAELGDFVLVGLHDDHTVNGRRGANLPIMNLHERTLSVLACRHVDEVIIGAPWVITNDMIKTMNISLVVHGTLRNGATSAGGDAARYELPRKMGIYRQLQSASNLTVDTILERVRNNRDAYVTRNIKKTAAEAEYLAVHKRFVEEQ